MTYVCFDIGGTNTRVALSADGSVLTDFECFKTPTSLREGVEKIVTAVEKLGGDPSAIKGAAGGIRGVLNEDRTGLACDGILTQWVGRSVVAELSEAFGGAPVFLENDTALAGLGEAHFGPGQGLDIVAYHTVSTGVGGVRIVSGVIDAASVGFEPGHQVIDVDRTILGPEIAPTLENFISGSALETRTDTKPYDIPQTDVIWDELARYLAAGLRNTTLYWSPDIIILGGSMIVGDPRIELDAIRHHTVESLDGFVDCPYIAHAKLDDASALYGALVFVRSQIAA